MIWVLIPVYNEAAGIPSMLETLRKSMNQFGQYSIVLVNDGSNDHSSEVIQNSLSLSDFSIHLEQNLGPGAAFLAGFEFILQKANQDDTILTLEGDGTADLSSLEAMFKAIVTHDLVLASVYLNSNGFSKTSAWRMFVSKTANAISRIYLGLTQRTLTSFYRLWSVALLQKMQIRFPKLIEEKGFICQVELLYKAKLLSALIIEIPTRVYSEKRIGQSKMKLFKTAVSHLSFLIRSKSIK